MKTRIILTIPILLFQLNALIADNTGEVLSTKPENEAKFTLSPSAPLEATFTDLVPDPAPAAISLAPVTPREATFGDEYAEILTKNSLQSLSPITPAEADFEDTIPTTGNPILAPISPIEASFDDII